MEKCFVYSTNIFTPHQSTLKNILAGFKPVSFFYFNNRQLFLRDGPLDLVHHTGLYYIVSGVIGPQVISNLN